MNKDAQFFWILEHLYQNYHKIYIAKFLINIHKNSYKIVKTMKMENYHQFN